MPRSLTALLVVLAATAPAIQAHAAGSKAPANPCAAADALKAAGAGKEARAEYVAILRTDPTGCAAQRLKELTTGAAPAATKSCDAADASFDEGKLPEARAAYHVLGADSKCGAAGLAAIRAVERLCVEGQALENVGNSDGAKKAYEGAAAKNANAPCVTKGLAATDPNWLSKAVDDVSAWLPNAVLVCGALLALLFVFLLLGRFRRLRQRWPRLPVVGRILNPRMTFAAFDSTAVIGVGPSLVSRIKQQLHQLRARVNTPEGFDYDLDLESGDERFVDIVSTDQGLQKALEGAKEISDHMKPVAAALGLLYAALPIRRLTIAGVIDPSVTNGEPAATLTLDDGPKLVGAVTVKGRPVLGDPKAADYMPLAEPAAVWLQYSVSRCLQGRLVDPREAESYALQREGFARHLADDESGARSAYERALALNPRNWAAAVNLALTMIRLDQSGSGNGYSSAIELLVSVLAEITGDAPIADTAEEGPFVEIPGGAMVP